MTDLVLTSERAQMAASNRQRCLAAMRDSFNREASLVTWESEADIVAGFAYRAERDKFDRNIPLSHHIKDVVRCVYEMYHGLIPEEHLRYLQMVAVLHELLEIKDDNKTPIWTVQDLRDLHFPEDLVLDVDALGKRKDEEYLDYVQRLAQRPNAVKVKLPDLKINTSPERMNQMPKILEELYIKKEYLYPLAQHYLLAVELKPEFAKKSVLQFAVEHEYIRYSLVIFEGYTKQRLQKQGRGVVQSPKAL